MNRNPIASFLRTLASRKSPAVVGGIVLFAALLTLEGVRATQWMSNASAFFTVPLVGGVASTTGVADDSGLKRSAPMIEISPFDMPLTTRDTVLTQGVKDKSLSRTTPPDSAAIPVLTGDTQVQTADPILTGNVAPSDRSGDDRAEGAADVAAIPDQAALPAAAPPAVPQAPAMQSPAAPPAAQPPAVQPPPVPSATTVPLPTPVPTQVPALPTEVLLPPPLPTQVPLPLPSPQGDSDDDDGNNENGDDNGNGDDNNDDDADDGNNNNSNDDDGGDGDNDDDGDDDNDDDGGDDDNDDDGDDD